MSEPIIQVRDVGVRFVRNRRRNLRLRELIIHRFRRQPSAQNFWPLRHLTFDVQPGEAVGVIGKNGTGKSTLLKVIAGVLIPDEGSVTLRGKVAPLLQLSAGFSGDLSGRDNVNLVGTLHGMKPAEVRRKFDEIVEFAGDQVRAAIDTPVRHYSSGMKVRLGFSLIAQLTHPILLVDEALAVGDKEFRKKCYVTIERLLAEGRTLVLVSHSERDLTRFCTRGLYINGGKLEVDGPIQQALDAYNAPATPPSAAGAGTATPPSAGTTPPSAARTEPAAATEPDPREHPTREPGSHPERGTSAATAVAPTVAPAPVHGG